jgi:hypothetical protein
LAVAVGLKGLSQIVQDAGIHAFDKKAVALLSAQGKEARLL